MKIKTLFAMASVLVLASCKDELPTEGGNGGSNGNGNGNNGPVRIYYSEDHQDNSNPIVYSIKPDGTDRKVVLTGLMVSPPGSGKIAYWLPNGGIGPATSYVADIDGGHPVLVANEEEAGEIKHIDAPMLSPDGSKVAYSAEGGRIIVTNSDSSRSWVITDAAADETRPTFSPDGSRLAFYGSDGALFVMKMSELGTGAPKAVATGARDLREGYSTLSWSPNSDKIAYTGYNGAYTDIFVVTLSTSSVVNVTHDEAGDFMPVWSPDGTRLAFGKEGQGLMIAALSAGTFSKVAAMSGGISPVFPQWSPDASRILYLINVDDGVGDLNMVDVNTKQVQRIAQNSHRAFWVQ